MADQVYTAADERPPPRTAGNYRPRQAQQMYPKACPLQATYTAIDLSHFERHDRINTAPYFGQAIRCR
jgi:hypothetical protein